MEQTEKPSSSEMRQTKGVSIAEVYGETMEVPAWGKG